MITPDIKMMVMIMTYQHGPTCTMWHQQWDSAMPMTTINNDDDDISWQLWASNMSTYHQEHPGEVQCAITLRWKEVEWRLGASRGRSRLEKQESLSGFYTDSVISLWFGFLVDKNFWMVFWMHSLVSCSLLYEDIGKIGHFNTLMMKIQHCD